MQYKNTTINLKPVSQGIAENNKMNATVNFKKYSSKQLVNMLNKAEGERAIAIRTILISRGIIQEEPQTSNTDILLEEARSKKGSKVKFLCTKTKTFVFGIIKGARLDKRNNFIQYRIKTLSGMFGKGIESNDIIFLTA